VREAKTKTKTKKKAAAKPGEKYSACVYLGGFTPKSLLLLSLSEHDSSAGGSESPSEAACAAAHGFKRLFFSSGLAQPALRVLLPLLPAAERGGGRRGGVHGSGQRGFG
jgi:hypothetical protein